jgi:hypothetical protein
MANEINISRNPNGRFSEVSGTLFVMALAILILPLVAGCSDDCSECPDPAGTYAPPYPPDGVFSITGDTLVTVCWNQKTEPNIVTYGIYVNDTELGEYEWIADVDAVDACVGGLCCFDDTDVNNGDTWFYAVTAIDDRGFESEDLSYETVFDTPRPEGFGLVLNSFLGQNGGLSGYDFSNLSNRAQPFSDTTTDIYFGTMLDTLTDKNVGWIFTTAGVDIQDYGLQDIDWAPDKGWPNPNMGRVQAIAEHNYVIRIRNSPSGVNFAKIYLSSVGDDQVTLDWAYQPVLTDPGNRELAPGSEGGGATR